MNRIAKLEIAVVIILVLCIGLYMSPFLKKNVVDKKMTKFTVPSSVFTKNAFSFFSAEKAEKSSNVEKKTMDELNF